MRGGQTISKGLGLVRAVAQSPDGCTFTELQATLGQPKATLHRLLQTMMEERFVRYDEHDRRYRLGYGLLELAGRAWAGLDIRDAAREALSQLRRDTGETVALAVLDGADVVWVDRIAGPYAKSVEPVIGTRSPAYCTAAGKVLLTFLPEAERRAILERITFDRQSAARPANRAALLMQLQQVRRDGFCVETDEQEVGSRGIAAPIFDSRNRPSGALGVTAPSLGLDGRRIATLARLTFAAAGEVTIRAGGQLPKIVAPAEVTATLELESPSWLPHGDVPC